MVVYAGAIQDALQLLERRSEIVVFEIQRWGNFRDIVCVII
jgi:hypothetical protein